MSDPAPIDAVIAWVDGTDPAHAAKRAQYLPFETGRSKAGSDATRFDQSGEIYICLASILANMPYVRTIWIVTDGQTPECLPDFARDGVCAPDRIRIVDHAALFADRPEILPVFNSRTIETLLWRIPGLAETYVYFNDDFFVNRPQPADRFFRNGTPVIAGAWKSMILRRLSEGAKDLVSRIAGRGRRDRPAFETAVVRGARMAGYRTRYLRLDHWPHPLRIGPQRDWYAANPDVLRAQVSHRFRNRAQFNPVSLAYHLERPDRVAPPHKVTNVNERREERVSAWLAEIAEGRTDFVVLQGLDRMDPASRSAILAGCAEKFRATLPAAAFDRLAGGQGSPGAPLSVSP